MTVDDALRHQADIVIKATATRARLDRLIDSLAVGPDTVPKPAENLRHAERLVSRLDDLIAELERRIAAEAETEPGDGESHEE